MNRLNTCKKKSRPDSASFCFNRSNFVWTNGIGAEWNFWTRILSSKAVVGTCISNLTYSSVARTTLHTYLDLWASSILSNQKVGNEPYCLDFQMAGRRGCGKITFFHQSPRRPRVTRTDSSSVLPRLLCRSRLHEFRVPAQHTHLVQFLCHSIIIIIHHHLAFVQHTQRHGSSFSRL